jgi:hypothetical protein
MGMKSKRVFEGTDPCKADAKVRIVLKSNSDFAEVQYPHNPIENQFVSREEAEYVLARIRMTAYSRQSWHEDDEPKPYGRKLGLASASNLRWAAGSHQSTQHQRDLVKAQQATNAHLRDIVRVLRMIADHGNEQAENPE